MTQINETVRVQPIINEMVVGGGKSHSLKIYADELLTSKVGDSFSDSEQGVLCGTSVKFKVVEIGQFSVILLREYEYWQEDQETHREASLICIQLR